jgi:hypothetical protein
VYFPLTDFLSAIKYFHFYIDYIQQSKETKEFSGILMDLKEIKSFHDSLLEKKDDQTLLRALIDAFHLNYRNLSRN